MSNPKSDRLLRRGKQIKTYELMDKIGEGGYGVVFSAKDLAGSKYALKVQRNNKIAQRELELMQLSQGSPYLVQLIESFVDNDYMYFVQELFFFSLWQWLNTYQSISPQNTCRVMLQTICALKHLFNKGVSHRDVNAANVMFDEQATKCVLIDLGCGKKSRSAKRFSTLSFNTVVHAAPSLNEGGEHQVWDDVISVAFLGLVCRLKPVYLKFNSESGKKMIEKKRNFLQDPGSLITKPSDAFLVPVIQQIVKCNKRRESYAVVLNVIEAQFPSVNLKSDFDRNGNRLA